MFKQITKIEIIHKKMIILKDKKSKKGLFIAEKPLPLHPHSAIRMLY
jgi:hypothetical protein